MNPYGSDNQNSPPAGQAFTAREGLDEKSKILIGTVSKIACDTQGKILSLLKLTRIVEKVAAGTGATGELLASLIRHLPKLFADVQVANLEAPEAYVSLPAKPQYKIWRDGEPAKIVSDISKYEKQKDNYLFWIDLEEEKHESTICPGRRIRPTAINLLIYLVERIGGRIPATDVLREVFECEPGGDKLDKYEKDQIQQQLRALQNFCGGQFREHLFPYKFNRGLGLQESFSNKYFIFTRLC